MVYTPSEEILQKYADVLVTAVNNYKGVKKGDVVWVRVPESARPMLSPLQRSVLRAGAHPLLDLMPENVGKDMFALSSDEQLTFVPESFMLERLKLVTASIYVDAEADPFELKDVNPDKVLLRQKAFAPYRKQYFEKMNKGELAWTLGLYGTPAMAAAAGMTEEEYWQEIIQACYLDQPDPVSRWLQTAAEIEHVQKALTNLSIEGVRVQGEKTDLHVTIGNHRRWLSGAGNNIPSFEIFTSPDCRFTEGTYHANQPLYYNGTVIRDITLVFKEGKIIEATAAEGQKNLQKMIEQENADMIGEFSLTDSRHSRITKPMATTLFDENIGGEHGNTHIAVGSCYTETFSGDQKDLTPEKQKEFGFNESPEHVDMVSTEPRIVTATLSDGSSRTIYSDGKFTL